ncbi:MAG: preprotein translocase subunit SecG, partial [Verrucomicrobia bacterium]|nr:preprotein translocase subunit SecG [Verrucomicrobiota bacterium]
MLSIFINLLLFVHVLVCFLIVGVVLMQRPKNEGLGAAFGAGTTDALFGAQTSNVLASITRWLTGIFFGLTLLLSALYARQGREKTGVEKRLQDSAQPIVPTVPSIPNEPLKAPASEFAPSPSSGGSIPAPVAPATQVPAESKPAPAQAGE